MSNGQAISRLIRTLVAPVAMTPYNFIWVDTNSNNRMKVMNIDTARSVILVNTGTPGTYNRVTTDIKGRVTSGAVDSTYVITRTLNINFTISTTRAAFVVYSIQSVSNAGNAATVFLEYSPDAVSWSEASRVSNISNGVGNTQIATVCGVIPANYFVRLRSVVAGASTNTFISGQETQL